MIDEKDDQQVAPAESSFDKFIRDEQGRFAKADEQSEPAPPAEPATPQASEPPAPPQTAAPAPAAPDPTAATQQQANGHIPIAALLDEREKRKELERRLREIEEKQQQQTKAPIPDPIADPEGYQQALDAQRQRDKQDLVFRFSEQFAARQHGPEVVKTAMEWLGEELRSNPALWSTIESHPDPAEHVVQLHKRHLRVSKLGDKDPDEYARELALARRDEFLQLLNQQGAPAAAAPSPQPPKPPPPRPSIASAPAAAPVAAQDHAYNEAEVFKGIFGKK
jgi:hypothetical protein